ncbi:SDR family oxidoreductase [Luteolibacter pohnpeiensis]|uniref:SDR family oxidoreductase n=1 Tax=Luteolibacter pohnpeiensis TaxID=454153 RepID=A0A934S5Y6_9BACT|nr:SDR family oxidoreductase [Luteolibacter pohnpeiensis]MBK1881880.1 SDR family oxidoreductase [Luteolibacter pohnpeiensis]
MNHQNKIALVTGSSRGLGKNIAQHLARAGADVIITYRTGKEEAEQVVSEIRALGRKAITLQLDVADTAGFAEFGETLKSSLATTWQREDFDFLINNAGIGINKSIADTTEDDFDQLMNVHFKGVYFLTQKLLPIIKDGGRIVNTSSGLARFSNPGYSAYASMKGAIEVFTRYLASEVGKRQITANVVAPGIIETDFTGGALAREGMREMMASQIALGRVGVPDDIGGVVNFLCSEAGRWVNAQRLEASGGMKI